MHNNYPLAPDKIEIKTEMLPHVVKYTLLIFAIFLLAILKNWPLTFLIKKSMCFNESQWLKSYFELNTQKIIVAEKSRDKDEKLLYKLMDNTVYNKAMENFKNKTDKRILSNEKDYLKWTSKPRYISQKRFDNNFVPICKNRVTLKLMLNSTNV